MAHHESRVIEINSMEEFNEKAKSPKVLLYFSATWCGPCKMIKPKYADLSNNHKDIVFLKIDVEEVEDLALKYNVSAMPTFILLVNGEVVDTVVGAAEQKLKDLIAKA